MAKKSAQPRPTSSTRHPSTATLPAAPNHTVQDTGKNRNCAKFFQYWKDLAGTVDAPTDNANLVLVKFYLHWPVIDPKLADPEATNKVFATIQGPIWFDNPDDYMDEVPKRLGSGEWHVVLNEVNVRGELMEAYFDSVDLDKYPPKIDLKSLVKGTKRNDDYIRWLKVNNVKTPWDNPVEEEDDMANTDALRIVAESLQRTTETAVNATQEAAEARVAAAEAGAERAAEISENRSTHETNAVKESIELVTTTAKEMVQMVSRNAGGQFNPIEMMRAAKEMMTPANEDGSVKLLLLTVEKMGERTAEMQTKQYEFMEKILKQREQAAAQPMEAGILGGLDGMIDQVDKLKRVADLFGWRQNGGHNEPPPSPAPPAKTFMESISENIVPFCTMITTIATIGGNILYNMRLKPGEAPQNPTEALAKAQQNNPALQFQQQQPQPQAHQQPQDPRVVWANFIEQIRPKIQAHFFEAELDGYSLADWILTDDKGTMHTPEGRINYVKITKQLGRPAFDQLIRDNVNLWPMLQGMPQKYEQFLDEFFGYDEWEAEQRKAEEGVTA